MNQAPFKDGGFAPGSQQAFPSPDHTHVDGYSGELAGPGLGMTVRQYLAAHAPITLIDANESLHQNPNVTRFGTPKDPDGAWPFSLLMKELVRLRWEYADLMLAEAEAGGGQ